MGYYNPNRPKKQLYYF